MASSKKHSRMDRMIVAPAKITCPVLSDVYPRTRVFETLDEAFKKPIVWISAPGGAGKTTAVASYLQARKLAALWYQIDRGDEDVASFFYYLGLAAKAHDPKCVLPLFTKEYLAGFRAFTANYFRELFAHMGRRSALVIDNYQEVPSRGRLPEILAEGFEQIPSDTNVIVISREPPPADFSRAMTHGSIAVVDWEALRLTEEESRAIVDFRNRKAPVAPDVVQRLHAATQGWVAGLVLLTEHTERYLIERESPAGFASQTVFDYFANEIFRHAEPHVRSVLMATAFFPMVSPILAEALTGYKESNGIFEALLERNLFIVKRPDGTFEYHPLFRTFLVKVAEENYSQERILRLKRQGAVVLLENDQSEMAVDLLIEATEWEMATGAIAKLAPSLLKQGRYKTLERWLAQLPSAVCASNPWTLYWSGCCRLMFSPVEARAYLEQAFAIFETQNDASPLYLTWCAIIESFIVECNDYTCANLWLDRYNAMARDRVAPAPEIVSASIFAYISILLVGPIDRPELPTLVARAEQLLREERNPDEFCTKSIPLIRYFVHRGNFAKVSEFLNRLPQPDKADGVKPIARLLYCVWKTVHSVLTGFPEQSFHTLKQGLALAEQTGIRAMDANLLGYGMTGYLAVGDVASARAILQKMSAYAGRGFAVDMIYLHCAAMVALHEGNLTQSLEYGRSAVAVARQAGSGHGLTLCLTIFAAAAAGLGEIETALGALADARTIAVRADCAGLIYFCDLTRANVLRLGGQQEESVRVLRDVLALARRIDITTTFYCHRDDLAQLYAIALEMDIEPEYVRAAIGKVRLVSPVGTISQRWPWRIKIYTFGRFAIYKDDVRLSFSGKVQKKPLELLRLLITLGPHGVSVEKLMELLWPDADTLNTTPFRSALMRLRRLVGEETVLLQEGRVTLNPHYCWVDIWALDRLCDAPIDSASVAERAERIFSLYQGEFLASEQDSMTVFQRDRLRSKFLRGIVKVGEVLETSGDFIRAVPLYQKAIEIDPLAEALYRRLMRCYFRLNQYAEALALYERCRVALSVLDISPNTETATLYRDIQQRIRQASSA